MKESCECCSNQFNLVELTLYNEEIICDDCLDYKQNENDDPWWKY